VTPGRRSSRWTCVQSGSTLRRPPRAAPVLAYSIASSTRSVSVAGSGQESFAAAARSRVSAIVLRAMPSERAIARSVAPPSYLRRRISLTRRIDTLSAGIGSPPIVPHDEQKAAPRSIGRATAPPSRGGRLQIGMAEIKSESVADFIPESVADLLRNQQGER
jgi:hypothetical protein